MDLEISGRWHHPVHVFPGRDRPANAPEGLLPPMASAVVPSQPIERGCDR